MDREDCGKHRTFGGVVTEGLVKSAVIGKTRSFSAFLKDSGVMFWMYLVFL